MVTFLGVAALGGLLLVIDGLRTQTKRLAELRGPAAVTSTRALSSVIISQAALRDWMLLKDEHFTRQRMTVWDRDIDPALEELTRHSTAWLGDDVRDIEQLNLAKKALHDLREAQWWIEEVSNAPGRYPAQVRYQQTIEPVSRVIVQAVSGLIDLEKQETTFGNKRNLSYMADFRASFLQSQLSLSEYAKAAVPNAVDKYKINIQVARKSLDNLNSNAQELSANQMDLLNWLNPEFVAYEFLANNLLKEVNHRQNTGTMDLAQHLLAQDAGPLAEDASRALKAISDDQIERMARQSARVTFTGKLTTTAGVAVLVGLGLISWLLARLGARHFIRPLQSLSNATRSISTGSRHEPLPIHFDDEIGQLTGAFNEMSDSLTRNRIELEQLAASQRDEANRVRSILDNTVDGIIVTNDRGIIDTTNPAAVRIFGYASEEMTGHNISMLMPEPHRSNHDKYIQNYLETGIGNIMGKGRQVIGKRKDGTTFPMDVAISQFEAQGQTMFTGIVRDITERMQTETKLIAARDEADRANAAKSEFLSRVSHELRTPLNSILGFAQLLEKARLEERSKQQLDRIIRAGKHLLHLINEVLDIASVESGRLTFSAEPVEINSILQETIELMQPLAAERSIVVEIDRGSDIEICAHVDRQRLKQILLNLLSNAIKYNREGGRVDIYWRCAEGMVRLSVADTGLGMNSEQANKIFNPFERAGAERTNIQGTGLGLALTKRLAKAMAGDIECTSQIGEGSIFVLSLPSHESQAKTLH